MGPTQDAIAQPYIGKQGTLGMGTKGPQSQWPLAGSNGYHGVLPTPINVTELEKVLSNQPDPLFVSSPSNSLN